MIAFVDRLAGTAAAAAGLCAGLVLLLAAIAKLRHRALLPGVIANYRILPGALVGSAAMLLPLVELATGAALLLDERRVAPAVAVTLLVVFAWAIAINLRRGRGHIDCGCGSPHLRQPLAWGMVWRNLLLAALLTPMPFGASRAPGAFDLAVAIAAGLSLALLYAFLTALLALPDGRARPA